MIKWLENIWYHYKGYILAFLFAIVVLVISIAQCASKPQYDYKIVVAVKNSVIFDEQLDLIVDELSKYGEDINLDGEVKIGYINCTFDEKRNDPNYVITMRQKLQITAMGDASALLYITDEDTFNYIEKTVDVNNGFFVNTGLPLKNGKAYTLSNIEFFKDLAQYENIPKELYISKRMVKGTIIEKDADIKKYETNATNLLNSILNDKK